MCPCRQSYNNLFAAVDTEKLSSMISFINILNFIRVQKGEKLNMQNGNLVASL
jgi:hypothetical protein